MKILFEEKKRKRSLEQRIKNGARIGALATLGTGIFGANLYEFTTACFTRQQNSTYTSQPYSPIPHSPLRNMLPASASENVLIGTDIAYGLVTAPGAGFGNIFCSRNEE